MKNLNIKYFWPVIIAIIILSVLYSLVMFAMSFIENECQKNPFSYGVKSQVERGRNVFCSCEVYGGDLKVNIPFWFDQDQIYEKNPLEKSLSPLPVYLP